VGPDLFAITITITITIAITCKNGFTCKDDYRNICNSKCEYFGGA
jgi:hypothetical protein